MRRATTIVAVWLLVLAGLAISRIWSRGLSPPDARDETIVADVERADPLAPLVVWVGDSTIRPMGQWTYPELVAGAFLAPAHVDSVVRAEVGFTFYQYYCLVGAMTAARPSLVVLVLNLRRMHEVPSSLSRLCSRLPAATLLGAVGLPLGESGMPFSRLLSVQLLRWPAVRAASRSFDLARVEANAAWWNVWHGDASPSADRPPPAAAFLAQWRRNVIERTGSTQMLAASVRLGRSSGAKVLVVVSPAPVRFLADADAWDAAGYRRMIARYRSIVEEAGGELIDLHDAVLLDGFRRAGGFTPLDSHLNSLGALHVATRLGPVVADMLPSKR